MKKRILLAAVSGSVLIFAGMPNSAMAHQMDYGAFESLFGEPVTASATGKPQRVSEAPVNMEIVTSEDIRRSGARTIPEALKGVTGLDVVQTGLTSFDVGIRGHNEYYNPRVLVMVNGRQVYIDNYGYTSWSNIPVTMNEIRQIEVVKGPNTALFGFNAVAGVINIITYNPQFDDVDNVTTSIGDKHDKRLSASQTFKLGEESGIRFSTGITSGQEFDLAKAPNMGGVNHIDPNDPLNKFVNMDGRFAVSKHGTLTTALSAQRSLVDEMITQIGYQRLDYESGSGTIGYAHETENWGLWEANLYHNINNGNVDSKNAAFDMNYNNEVTVLKLQNLFKIGAKHSVRLSGEYRHNWEESTGDLGAVSYDVYSGGAMWDWAMTDSLSWTNALRFDKLYLDRTGSFQATNPFTNADYNVDLNAVSANSGLVWKATPTDSVAVSYARGIQIPSLVQFGALELNLGPLYFTGTPNLDPAVATTYEASYTHKVPSLDIAGNDLSAELKAAVFHNNYQHILGYNSLGNPSISPITYLYDNVGSSEAIGLELSAKGKLNADWRWGLNYVAENITDHMRDTTAYTYDKGRTPRHMANAKVGYSQELWEADAALHYVSGRKMFTDTTPLAPFDMPATSVDPILGITGRIGYKIMDNLTISLNGSNLQSAKSEQSSGREVNRALWLSASWNF